MIKTIKIKTIKAKDLSKYLDFLVVASSGNSIYIQEDIEGFITFEYDDGILFGQVPEDMEIMLLENGNLFINKLEFIPYRSVKVNLRDKI